MDLPKIKTLIDFVARSNVTELSVTEKDVTVRIIKSVNQPSQDHRLPVNEAVQPEEQAKSVSSSAAKVHSPIFGVLHRASAPGAEPFVKLGDLVQEGQTLFIIEAMKVFNKVSAPCAGRILFLTDVDGGEVDANDLLAEIG
ncbi:acetyl-CoA carboxylase biotin carboxyl carrier protein subunit [Rhizobium sp. Leaf262]|uniref:acetyl-CoA carboxylase biotin carboxyl carrier protein n=1 Tax=Rhizobium sp. Leaf262 TaxID=1736312 RepID=UPI0007146BB7|nr:acetyl-CoA carboxylase biotin carboxyl carrier protein subunit [Rhizobium sp. Leaf262]KQO76198.1 acetyl-CoA carboxylase biotin carboxyl carrier protein subunit [Rhizobium sp. Leaf262]